MGVNFVGAAAPVEIEIWHRWGGLNNEVLQEIVDKFNAEYAGEIVVKNSPIPGEYLDVVEKIVARKAARQDPPDISSPGHYLMSYTVKALEAVDLATVAGDELEEVASRFSNPDIWDFGKVDGQQYGVPFVVSTMVMYWNPDIFKAAGLDPDRPPQTWEEVRQFAEQIRKNTQYDALFISLPQETWALQNLLAMNGVQMKVDGKAAFNTPEAVEVMEMYRSFYADGLIPLVSYTEAERGFQSGRVGMMLNTIMRYQTYKEYAPWLRVGPMPSFGDKPKRLVIGGSSFVMLSQDPAKQKAAWRFMEYLTRQETMALWVKTGYLNPLKAEVPLAYPEQGIATEQLAYGVGWVDWGAGAAGLEAEQIIVDARDRIIYGREAAQPALDKAVRDINAMIGD